LDPRAILEGGDFNALRRAHPLQRVQFVFGTPMAGCNWSMSRSSPRTSFRGTGEDRRMRLRCGVRPLRIWTMRDVADCLGCEIVTGKRAVPGGIVHQTAHWIVNHAVGRLSLGTLVVAPRDHVVAVADLDDEAAAELGTLLRDAARVVEAICRPEQTYVCVWSHGQTERRHLHMLVQPVTAALVAQYGGLRSERLQARIMIAGEPLDDAEVEQFCQDARQRFASRSTGAGVPPRR
jgi:diadenosine tetraphosphate (Ap4A) HIT family hydrolase